MRRNAKQIGLPRCPFDITTLPVSDGRKTGITNSGFGTVFAVADGKPDASLRLCRIRPVRLRLSPLPRRATDDRRVRGFSPQGVARQDRLPQSQSTKAWKGSGWAGRGDRRRHRVLEARVSACLDRRSLRARERLREAQMRARSARPANRFRTLASVCVAAVLVGPAWPRTRAQPATISTHRSTAGSSTTTQATRPRLPPRTEQTRFRAIRSNVFAQSVVLTRIMDYWGRTGGLSIVLPYALIDTSAGPFRASTNGVSDVGFLWQMNIFGGPALTRADSSSRSFRRPSRAFICW